MMIPIAVLLGAVATPIPDADAPPTRPLRLALTSSSAFGLTNARFFNQLVGARLEYRFTPRFAFGGALSYANLKGKDERVHNVLPEATTEYRLPLQPASIGIPLRFSLGFLPKNGPTLRVAAGIDFQLSERVSLEILPLEPMIWVVRERPELSLDASLALRLSL